MEESNIMRFNITRETKKRIAIGLAITILAMFIGILLFIFVFSNPVKSKVTLEVGEELSIKQFLKKEEYESEAAFITDISKIDLNVVAEHEIEIAVKEKRYKSTLKLVKTTPPRVVFQDVERYIDYEIKAEDFIKENHETGTLAVFIEEAPIITDFVVYKVTVVVKDKYGNEISKECNLNITPVRTVYELELGNKIEVKEILLNPTVDMNIISREEIDRINASDVGDYELVTWLNEKEYKTKIMIRDTNPPTLVLKEVMMYLGETSKSVDSFVSEKHDVSGEVTLNLLTEIDYKKEGVQNILIEAIDKYNNKIVQGTKLHIIKDTRGPIFSGLSDVSINKNARIDWKSGVTAKDPRDGSNVNFTVNFYSANLATPGTYHATYSATDKLGNKTEIKRKVTVEPDISDINAKADEWLMAVGASGMWPETRVIAIRNYVRDNITYNTTTLKGVEVAAWKGMTTLNGDCYIYAATMQLLLARSGVQSIIVNASDNTHYWNMVNVSGSWRHIDAMPSKSYEGFNYMNDEERKATLSVIRERDWDRNAFPVAE